MPRDKLLEVTEKLTRIPLGNRSFPRGWADNEPSFAPVKIQYKRMLKILGEPHADQWREKIGIDAIGLKSLKQEALGDRSAVAADP